MPRDYKHLSRKKTQKKSAFNFTSFGIGLGIGLALSISVYLATDLPSLSAFVIERL